MKIAIDVAGLHAGRSDGFRRAMGTWRSNREMEKLHAEFVDGCIAPTGMTDETPRSCSARCAAFASFGFDKIHAAAFARTAYESGFLKLFYPAQFVVGLINAQPMGFYPVEVLVNDAKRHGVAVLPVDVNASATRPRPSGSGGRAGPARRATTARRPEGAEGAGSGTAGRGRSAPRRASCPARRSRALGRRERWAGASGSGSTW